MMFSRKINSLCELLFFNSSKFLKLKGITYSKFYSLKRNFTMQLVDDQGRFDKGNGVPKKITRLNYSDVTLSNIMLQVKSKKTRIKSNLIYFEGKRLLIDALNSGIVPLYIYFSRTEDIAAINVPEATQLLKVPYNDLKIWSDLTTCPGILTICRKPDVLIDYHPSIPVSIICDNVREPGNLGSIIRNSAGAGVKKVYLSKGCNDLWDSKVLRGAMGAHFRIPIYNEVTWDFLSKSINKDTLLLIATNQDLGEGLDSNGENIELYYDLPYKDYNDITLVIGGETEGISRHSYEIAKSFNTKKITIPLCNGVESLNNVSAMSVLLFEIKRQYDTVSNKKA